MIDKEHYQDSDVVPGSAITTSYQQLQQTSSDGYMVKGAPWSAAAPDTNSRDDFPDLAQVTITLC